MTLKTPFSSPPFLPLSVYFSSSSGWIRSLYSSSPGQLASLDDLYVLRGERGGGGKRRQGRGQGRGGGGKGGGHAKQMVITETTISMVRRKKEEGMRGDENVQSTQHPKPALSTSPSRI